MSDSPRILTSWLIGSHASCDLVVNHPTVSAQHCRLTEFPAGFTVEDLGSTNGTYVDGARIDSNPGLVQNGSLVSLSEHRYRFREI